LGGEKQEIFLRSHLDFVPEGGQEILEDAVWRKGKKYEGGEKGKALEEHILQRERAPGTRLIARG